MDLGYTLQNFFTHKDYLDKDRLVGTMFETGHFIGAIIFLALVIGCIILVTKKCNEKQYKTILTVIWGCLVCFEFFKIMWETFSGKTVSFELGGNMPLYPCSIIMYALPFAIWGKKYVKMAACGYICTLGLLGATVNFFYPATVLPNYSILSFAGFHTMLYHGAMLFCALTMLTKGYHSYKEAKKWYELLIPSIPSLIVSIPANIINYSLEVDYMWFRGTSFFLPAIFGYNYKSTPTIMLKGQWLKEAGFDCGTSITVTCEEGKLIITPREEISFIDAFEKQQISMVAEKGEYC